MDKLKMHSLNKVDDNIKKIGALFPNCVTERKNDAGEVEYAIDFDMLKQELSAVVVEGKEERYQFTWPDKKKSILAANAPISDTLRPCREESVDFDNTQNLYIEGDNLAVLKLLQETYLGKIKMIYIDPPYNTGNDFVYNDDFAESAEEYLAHSGQFDEDGNRLVANTESNGRFHTDWLNMMYTRLRLAKDLLADNGVIFVSLDDNELSNLIKMCNEIFGEENFVTNFVWEKKKKPSFLHKNVGKLGDYIVCYTKSTLHSVPFSIETTTEGKKYPLNNAGNTLATITFPPHSVKFIMSDTVVEPQNMSEGNIKTELLTTLIIKDGYNQNEFSLRGEWRYSQAKINEIIRNGEELVISKIPFRPNHIKAGGEIKKMKNFLTTTHYHMETNEDATEQVTALFGKDIFDNPKPIKLIKSFVQCITYDDKDAIILDFFSGSATTAHAVMQLNAEDGGNRKFIMVQLPEETAEKSEAYKAGYKNICEIGKERIRRAGAKIKADRTIKIDVDKSQLMQRTLLDDGTFDDKYALKVTPANDDDVLDNLDTGFRVLKLDSSNMKDVYYTPDEYEINMFDMLSDNIKEDRTPEDLLFQVMLDLGVLLSSKIEEEIIAGKKVFNVADGFMYACFDNNVSEETITEIAKKKPYYFVMRDSSMANDSVATNFEQIFATYSPDTERKVL